MSRKTRIGVMGSSRCDAKTAELAETVGRGIAVNGAVLICGGGSGIMEAAARGASKAGGFVVGILPSDNEATANRWVDLPIVTGMANARNAINVLTSHVVIAIAGGPGTLSEIALALKVGRPVVGLHTWDAAIDGHRYAGLPFESVATAEEAVDRALSLARHHVPKTPEG